MKETVKIIYLLPFLFQSCVDVGSSKGSRTLINDSGRDIVIISYRDLLKDPKYWKDPKYSNMKETYVFDKNINLKNKEKLSFSKKLFSQNNYINISELIGDSIIIDYSDKIKRYGSTIVKNKVLIKDDVRNPYFVDFGYGVNDLTYIITPEDYAKADPKIK